MIKQYFSMLLHYTIMIIRIKFNLAILHTPPHVSQELHMSPHVSQELHMSPHVSQELHMSPHVSTCLTRAANTQIDKLMVKTSHFFYFLSERFKSILWLFYLLKFSLLFFNYGFRLSCISVCFFASPAALIKRFS